MACILQKNGAVDAATANPLADLTSAPRRILIVEDNDQARQKLQQLLTADPKLIVDAVSNGRQALHNLSEQNYSIVPTVKYISDVVIKKQ